MVGSFGFIVDIILNAERMHPPYAVNHGKATCGRSILVVAVDLVKIHPEDHPEDHPEN